MGETIGDRIRECLRLNGMTQRELAEKVGCTEASMSRYCNGNRVMKATTIANVAKVLRTTPGYLLGTGEVVETKLKLCPFCGGEAEFYRTPVKTNGGWCDGVVVRCKVCDARSNRILYNKAKHGTDGEYDEAAKAWNARKPLEKIVGQLEEYREDFMFDIYEELREDCDNSRANRIIDRFDEAIQIVKGGGVND